jgi:hypothetical protein
MKLILSALDKTLKMQLARLKTMQLMLAHKESVTSKLAQPVLNAQVLFVIQTITCAKPAHHEKIAKLLNLLTGIAQPTLVHVTKPIRPAWARGQTIQLVRPSMMHLMLVQTESAKEKHALAILSVRVGSAILKILSASPVPRGKNVKPPMKTTGGVVTQLEPVTTLRVFVTVVIQLNAKFKKG